MPSLYYIYYTLLYYTICTILYFIRLFFILDAFCDVSANVLNRTDFSEKHQYCYTTTVLFFEEINVAFGCLELKRVIFAQRIIFCCALCYWLSRD